MDSAPLAPDCAGFVLRARRWWAAVRSRRRPMDRGSARCFGRWVAAAVLEVQARGATTVDVREPAPAAARHKQKATGRAAGRHRQKATGRAAAHRRRKVTVGARRARPEPAVNTRRAVRSRAVVPRSPAVVRTGLAAPVPAKPRGPAARDVRRSQAPPWHQTDSCPPGTRNVLEQARNRLDRAARAATRGAPERAARIPVRRRAATALATAARAAGRIVVELEPALVGPGADPSSQRVAAQERAGEHRTPVGQLPWPTGSRRTGKTCWWAGSRRRTACTRSCENSRARAVPRSLARLSAGSIPVFRVITQLKGPSTPGHPLLPGFQLARALRKERRALLGRDPQAEHGWFCRSISPRVGLCKNRRLLGDRGDQRSFSS